MVMLLLEPGELYFDPSPAAEEELLGCALFSLDSLDEANPSSWQKMPSYVNN